MGAAESCSFHEKADPCQEVFVSLFGFFSFFSRAARKLSSDNTTGCAWGQVSGYAGGFDRWMQHHLIKLLFKDGVYEALEAIETLADPKKRDLDPLEVWAVVKRDRPRLWQAVELHSLFVGAPRRHSSSGSPTVSAIPHSG